MYLPIFINLIRKEKDFSVFNRYVAPTLAILCSVFMVYAAFASHGVRAVCGYLVVYVEAIGRLWNDCGNEGSTPPHQNEHTKERRREQTGNRQAMYK